MSATPPTPLPFPHSSFSSFIFSFLSSHCHHFLIFLFRFTYHLFHLCLFSCFYFYSLSLSHPLSLFLTLVFLLLVGLAGFTLAICASCLFLLWHSILFYFFSSVSSLFHLIISSSLSSHHLPICNLLPFPIAALLVSLKVYGIVAIFLWFSDCDYVSDFYCMYCILAFLLFSTSSLQVG